MRSIEVQQLDLAGDIDEPIDGDLPRDQPGALDRVSALGHDRLPVGGVGAIDWNRNDLAVGRVLVRSQIHHPVDDAERVVLRVGNRIERADWRIDAGRMRMAQVFDEELILRIGPLVGDDPQIAAGFVACRPQEQSRIVRAFVDQAVGRLRRAERVVIHLVIAQRHLQTLARRRFGIALVEEPAAVLRPHHVAELGPFDLVGLLLAVREIAHVVGDPVGSAFRLAVDEVLVVGRRLEIRERDRAVR